MLNRIQDSKTLTEFFFDEIETKNPPEHQKGWLPLQKSCSIIESSSNGVLKEILINTLAEKTGIDSVCSKIA